MSKELTEKWKNKELKDGDYYVINKAGDIVCDYYIEILGHFDSVLTENVKEVLAPVPSYDEWKQAKENIDKDGTWYTERSYKRIETQLEIATKALNGIRDVWANNPRQFSYIARIANRKAKKALEEMEGVK